MKRRSFIKLLGAAILSPFLPSGSPSAEIAIPDPALIPYPTTILLDQRRRRKIGRIYGPKAYFNSEDYGVVSYYSGDQWPKEAQRKLNKRRSLIINKIVK